MRSVGLSAGQRSWAETFITPTAGCWYYGPLSVRGNSKKFEEMGFHGMDYGTAIAYSPSGDIRGPYIHEDKMITPPNMGHCNLFYRNDGQLMLATHYPR